MTVVVQLRPREDRPPREIIAERVRVTRDGQYLLVEEPNGTEHPIRPELVRQILPGSGSRTPGRGTSVGVRQARRRHAFAYGPWTREEDRRLHQLRGEGSSLDELSQTLGRSKGAIRDRCASSNGTPGRTGESCHDVRRDSGDGTGAAVVAAAVHPGRQAVHTQAAAGAARGAGCPRPAPADCRGGAARRRGWSYTMRRLTRQEQKRTRRPSSLPCLSALPC